MSDALEIMQRLTGVLFGLTCLGAPFLLWNRSKNAALLGAASGAVLLFATLVDFVVEHAQGSGATPSGAAWCSTGSG